jgi:hypothetical protein
MAKQGLFVAVHTGAAAILSATGLLALSACNEQPYPSPTHSEAPPSPPAELMGAPDQGSPYTAAAPVMESDAPAPPYRASAPSVDYDRGAVIAMAPIPNPGDPGSEGYYGDYHGRRRHYDGRPAYTVRDTAATSPYGEGHPVPGRHPTYASAAYPPPTYTRAQVHGKATSAPVATNAAPFNAHASTVKTATVSAPPRLPAVVAVTDKGAAAAGGAAAPAGDRATRLASFQAALTDVVGKSGMLTAPASFTANQPADVSLVLPHDFADTLRGEAKKDGLSDAAASVNMTALLSGDGFAVTPADIQSAPLTVGQTTEFHWTVTAQPGAKGPLHADVGADLLGGGSDKLSLGSVQKTADLGVKLTPRVVGASLLVLIAALVVAWLARGRGPTRAAAARRAARRAARGGRPLDMTSSAEEAATP